MADPITCPNCGKRFAFKPELVGRRVKCPKCGDPFVVPAPVDAIEPVVEQAPPPPAPLPSAVQMDQQVEPSHPQSFEDPLAAEQGFAPPAADSAHIPDASLAPPTTMSEGAFDPDAPQGENPVDTYDHGPPDDTGADISEPFEAVSIAPVPRAEPAREPVRGGRLGLLLFVLLVLIVGGGLAVYFFYPPHRAKRAPSPQAAPTSRPDPMAAYEAQYAAASTQHGSENTVRLEITGVQNRRAESDRVFAFLKQQVPSPSLINTEDGFRCVAAPVKDFDAFVHAIDFGTVSSVDQGRHVVIVSLAPVK